MKKMKILALLLSMSVILWNCTSKSEEEEAKEEPKTGLEAIQKMADEAEKMSKEGPKETVDPKLLKALLPDDADGLKRSEASSEKSSAMGFGVSTAKASYRDDSGQDIDINITDVAGMGVALMTSTCGDTGNSVPSTLCDLVPISRSLARCITPKRCCSSTTTSPTL